MQMDKKFRLRGGYRYIKKTDQRRIISGNQVMDSISLEDLYNLSLKDNNIIIIVKEEKKKPVAFMEIIKNSPFHVELISVDQRFQKRGLGTSMLHLAEKIALKYGFTEIRLDSVEDKVEFYRDLGYTEYGEMFYDYEWGNLQPMKKKIKNYKY
ncbi:Acetyltransferase (GNAT) family protein [Picrophilus oshimae DSM 9789]|uniref:Acetyltransferase (GNAT) family protein n=2 Tax=Picrophilus oshimae TaxID=46632 RepID=A0A8G2FW85_PICTO|nr:Acetyltransferase (GNAT) family protein [Picrophilus oshimae DSM 9789]